jgi:2-oxo-4-hydroxy-4-carboxy--5-ureidoimidazoline (OHCU) decarboxylase
MTPSPPKAAGRVIRTLPPVAELDRLAEDAFIDAVAPLFESAPRFLRRLAAARPFGTPEAMFARAREIARAMPEEEQLELVDAHPRLGAPPGQVSRLSFGEQGYNSAQDASGREAEELGRELDALNAAYEATFGFRYCVWVAGRSRADLVPEMRTVLDADREAELARALDAVVDIATDRYRKLTGGEGEG